MNIIEKDIIVIGGGTAGLSAYRKSISLGLTAVIIEKYDFVTTCASVGCMPSKLLIAASERNYDIENSKVFGINVIEKSIDEKALFERVRTERDRFVGFVKKGANNIDAKDKIIGEAEFIDENTIKVNNLIYKAKAIIIATGSKPNELAFLNEVRDNILTNENVFELNHIPKKIAIFGAGVIGLELGFAFKNLGSDITLFNTRKEILGLNEKINAYAINHIEENMSLVLSSVQSVIKKDNKVVLKYNDENHEFDKIIVATGRSPNLMNIEKFVPNILELYNDKTTKIKKHNIFLAGDVNNNRTLLHEAALEGEIAAINAFNVINNKKVKSFKRKTKINVIFSHPQIMSVGNTTINENTIVGEVSYEDQGRSRVMNKNKGILQLYFSKNNKKLVGAQMIGPNAENIAHQINWLIECNINIHKMISLPFYHPVVEEGIRTAIRDAISKI